MAPCSARSQDLIGLSDLVRGRLLVRRRPNAARPMPPASPYPENNPLSRPLMTVAQAIKEDLGLRVATVDVPGWDTHVNQAGQFGDLVGGLSAALMAFWRDLGPRQQDVSVVVMSEFGRRLHSNTGGGTDHGRGNVMMVLGPQAKGGRMVGAWPGLANEALEEGADLAVVTDYRDVLAELLTGHMGLADPGRVFPGLATSALGFGAERGRSDHVLRACGKESSRPILAAQKGMPRPMGRAGQMDALTAASPGGPTILWSELQARLDALTMASCRT